MTTANIGHPFHICRHPWGYIARFISRKISGMGGWIEGFRWGRACVTHGVKCGFEILKNFQPGRGRENAARGKRPFLIFQKISG